MQYSVFDRILGILCSVLDAYSVALFMPDPFSHSEKSRTYKIISSFSLGDKIDVEASIPEGKGLVGWILRNSEPLLVANFDQRQNYLGYYKDSEEQSIKAFMGYPLSGNLGAICVDSKRQYSFSEKDQKMLHLFSELIAQLYKSTLADDSIHASLKYYIALQTIYNLRRHHLKWLDFLDHFLNLMASITNFSYCLFCSRDSYGENYTIERENYSLLTKSSEKTVSFPMSHGIVGWVFRNNMPVISDSSEGAPEALLVGGGLNIPHFQSIIAFPLVIQNKTRGVLCLANESPMILSEYTKNFVSMASEHMALFLENLYIKCRLRDLHNSLSGK